MTEHRNKLTGAIRARLPSGCSFAGGGHDVPGNLTPAEARLVSASVEKRVVEFRAGRFYARSALAGLGHPPAEILAGSQREPRWPTGIIGSISHCAGYCGAVAARANHLKFIGLDIELSGPLELDLVHYVCTKLDVENNRDFDQTIMPKIIFCVKESVYKAYFPQTKCYLDFLDVNVTLDDGESYTAEIVNVERNPLLGFRQLRGVFGILDDHLYAICYG